MEGRVTEAQLMITFLLCRGALRVWVLGKSTRRRVGGVVSDDESASAFPLRLQVVGMAFLFVDQLGIRFGFDLDESAAKTRTATSMIIVTVSSACFSESNSAALPLYHLDPVR